MTWIKTIAYVVFVSILLYLVVACAVFQWRNPKANRMSLLRHFGKVVTFEKMEEYQ